MSREPIRIRRIFQTWVMRPSLLWEIRRRFHRLCPGYGQVAHALRTLSPVAGRVLLLSAAPRLACVKPAASVHPEPGSNSSLYIYTFSLTPWTFLLLFRINVLEFKCLLLQTCSVLACTYLSIFQRAFHILSRKWAAKITHYFYLPNFFQQFFSLFSALTIFVS